MAVATIFDVVAAREALEASGIPCELHLHDACGAQTMELRPQGAAAEDTLAQAFEVVATTFAARGLVVELTDDEGHILRVV
ncbi:MAG: hypothetical protein IKE22_02245 [Atopobiaceae bacterium]|nr:hypothetical protein [Atopobiaceae bacterium]